MIFKPYIFLIYVNFAQCLPLNAVVSMDKILEYNTHTTHVNVFKALPLDIIRAWYEESLPSTAYNPNSTDQ